MSKIQELAKKVLTVDRVLNMHNAMIDAYEPHIIRLDALTHKAFENADFIVFMKRTLSENVDRLTRTLLLDYLEYKLIDEPYQQNACVNAA